MSPNQPRAGTSRHQVRLDDTLWQAASAKAAAEGTNVSALVRGWLEEYVEEPRVSLLWEVAKRRLLDAGLDFDADTIRIALHTAEPPDPDEMGAPWT